MMSIKLHRFHRAIWTSNAVNQMRYNNDVCKLTISLINSHSGMKPGIHSATVPPFDEGEWSGQSDKC